MSDEKVNGLGCDPADCAACGGCSDGAGIPSTITLTLMDDSEVRCSILTTFPMEGREYIVLLPVDDEGQAASAEVYLYRFSMTAGGDPMLTNIEDDDEYVRATEVFDEILQNAKTVAAADPEE